MDKNNYPVCAKKLKWYDTGNLEDYRKVKLLFEKNDLNLYQFFQYLKL